MALVRDRRGRLTLPDLALTLFSFALLAALWPVFTDALERHAADMTAGEVYLYQLILPAMLIVLFGVIFVVAVGGSS